MASSRITKGGEEKKIVERKEREKKKKKNKRKVSKVRKSLSVLCNLLETSKTLRAAGRQALLTRPVICLSFAGYAKEPSRQSWSNQPDQVQRYFCPRCCSSFSKKANMLTHFRYECGKEPRFQCPYCGKRDRKSSNTYRHIRTYHQGSRIQAYKLY